MTQLENAMDILVKTFDKYAAAEGSSATLTKSEVKTLVEKELPKLLTGGKNQEGLNSFMKELELDKDAEVDFNNFVLMMTGVILLYHGRFPGK